MDDVGQVVGRIARALALVAAVCACAPVASALAASEPPGIPAPPRSAAAEERARERAEDAAGARARSAADEAAGGAVRGAADERTAAWREAVEEARRGSVRDVVTLRGLAVLVGGVWLALKVRALLAARGRRRAAATR